MSTSPPSGTPLSRWLQAMFWGAVIVPVVVFGAACWWGYERAFDDATRTVVRANAVVLRHAESTVTQAADLADRARRLVHAPDAELRAREGELHQRLDDMTLALPAVAAISVWDAEGRALVGSRVFPVATTLSIAQRPYFIQQRARDQGLILTERLTGSLSGEVHINAVIRRTLPDGSFGGVVLVSLHPKYFQDFYRSLASEEPGLATFSLFKADGALLTRWPEPASSTHRVPERSSLLAPARAGEDHGVLFAPSSFDSERRLFSFHRVAGQPVYVTAALSESAIFARWHRFVAWLAAIVIPATAGLLYVSGIALKKTRREQAMLVELRDENRRRAQAEQALMQTQKLEALAQLTGGVAHDFNNLLAVISNNLHVQTRLHPELGGELQGAAIAKAVAAGVRLTRQLLSFSHRQPLSAETLVLQEWLPAVGDLIRTTVGRGIELTIEVAAGTAPVHVDPEELELALINIAVNAKEAMADRGRLRITAADVAPAEPGNARKVVIRVADTGPGIAPEVIGKVFDPFFSTKGPARSSGLGLSQVYGLCVQAGGTATIESAADRGTTVSMWLPAAGSLAAAAPKAALPRTLNLRGSILLVEDNDDVAGAIDSLLRSAGLTVRLAVSADAAFAMLVNGSESFDAVLSDIVLPGSMNGIQLAVRLQSATPSLPVLLMTGYAARLHEATAAGLQVLSKPTDPLELLAALDRALAEARDKRGRPALRPAAR